MPAEQQQQQGQEPTPAAQAAPEPEQTPKSEPKPTSLPDDPAALKTEVERLRRENAASRKKVREIEETKAKAEKDALEKQGKYRELYEQEKARADRAAEAEGVAAEMYEAEMASVPQKYLSLVPAGSSVEQLKWIRNAKASGLFAPSAPASDPNPKNPAPPSAAPPPPNEVAPEEPSKAEYQAYGLWNTAPQEKARIRAKIDRWEAYRRSRR